MTSNCPNRSNAAAKKMRAFGLKRLCETASCHLATLYKWEAALNARRGVADKAKRRLIEGTAGSPDASSWSDFDLWVSE